MLGICGKGFSSGDRLYCGRVVMCLCVTGDILPTGFVYCISMSNCVNKSCFWDIDVLLIILSLIHCIII